MLTQIAEGVLVHPSELLRNNAVVVQGPSGVLLVDPGLTDAEMSCLADDLRELGQPVTVGFATHPDWDHVLWHERLGDVPRYSTRRCAEFMRDLRSDPDWKTREAGGLPPEIADDVPLDLYGLLTALPTGAETIPWDGPHVRIIEHPAHAPGHAALLVEEHGVLIAGDMLSDLFVPMLDLGATSDPIQDYLLGLEKLDAVADRVEVLAPGHGSVAAAGDVRARIDSDRAYVCALRDGRDPVGDPRVGPSAEPGWEWVSDIHTGQVQSLAQRTGRSS